MPLFSFNLDSFQITDTRSAHTDTDYASVAVKVGGNTPQTITSPNLGNLNNGTFDIGLSCAGVTIDPDTPIVFNYLIVNSGSSTAAAVGLVLEEIGTRLANGPTLNLPLFTSALSYVAAEYSAELNQIIKAGSCDGLVAAEQNTFTYGQLIGFISTSYSFARPTVHKGGLNPHGCNSKTSQYIANWSMAEVVSVPSSILNERLGAAEQTLTNLQLMPKVVSGPNVANAYVCGAKPTYPVVHGQVQLTTSNTPCP
jgi:hypothetical protein